MDWDSGRLAIYINRLTREDSPDDPGDFASRGRDGIA